MFTKFMNVDGASVFLQLLHHYDLWVGSSCMRPQPPIAGCEVGVIDKASQWYSAKTSLDNTTLVPLVARTAEVVLRNWKTSSAGLQFVSRELFEWPWPENLLEFICNESQSGFSYHRSVIWENSLEVCRVPTVDCRKGVVLQLRVWEGQSKSPEQKISFKKRRFQFSPTSCCVDCQNYRRFERAWCLHFQVSTILTPVWKNVFRLSMGTPWARQ